MQEVGSLDHSPFIPLSDFKNSFTDLLFVSSEFSNILSNLIQKNENINSDDLLFGKQLSETMTRSERRVGGEKEIERQKIKDCEFNLREQDDKARSETIEIERPPKQFKEKDFEAVEEVDEEVVKTLENQPLFKQMVYLKDSKSLPEGGEILKEEIAHNFDIEISSKENYPMEGLKVDLPQEVETNVSENAVEIDKVEITQNLHNEVWSNVGFNTEIDVSDQNVLDEVVLNDVLEKDGVQNNYQTSTSPAFDVVPGNGLRVIKSILTDGQGLGDQAQEDFSQNSPEKDILLRSEMRKGVFMQDVAKVMKVEQSRQEEMIQRIAKVIKTAHSNNTKHVKMILQPPRLGTLKVDLSVGNGSLSAVLQTDNLQAKNLLSVNLPNLMSALEDSGINVGNFEVFVKGEGRNSSSANRRQFSNKDFNFEQKFVDEDRIAIEERLERTYSIPVVDMTI